MSAMLAIGAFVLLVAIGLGGIIALAFSAHDPWDRGIPECQCSRCQEDRRVAAGKEPA